MLGRILSPEIFFHKKALLLFTVESEGKCATKRPDVFFGILLCISSGELNGTILHGFSYFPFSFIGLIAGVVGLIMIFRKDRDKKDV